MARSVFCVPRNSWNSAWVKYFVEFCMSKIFVIMHEWNILWNSAWVKYLEFCRSEIFCGILHEWIILWHSASLKIFVKLCLRKIFRGILQEFNILWNSASVIYFVEFCPCEIFCGILPAREIFCGIFACRNLTFWILCRVKLNLNFCYIFWNLDTRTNEVWCYPPLLYKTYETVS